MRPVEQTPRRSAPARIPFRAPGPTVRHRRVRSSGTTRTQPIPTAWTRSSSAGPWSRRGEWPATCRWASRACN